MTNKQKLTLRLQSISDKLQTELDYYLNNVDHEEIPDYDITDAFEDYTDIMLPPSLNTECRNIMVDIGYAIEVDISKVVVSHGSKYWFKIGDKYYQCVSSWEQFINL